MSLRLQLSRGLLIWILDPTVIDCRKAFDQRSLDRVEVLQRQAAFIKLTIQQFLHGYLLD